MNATIVINARRFMVWKPNLECRLIVIYGIQVKCIHGLINIGQFKY